MLKLKPVEISYNVFKNLSFLFGNKLIIFCHIIGIFKYILTTVNFSINVNILLIWQNPIHSFLSRLKEFYKCTQWNYLKKSKES